MKKYVIMLIFLTLFSIAAYSMSPAICRVPVYYGICCSQYTGKILWSELGAPAGSGICCGGLPYPGYTSCPGESSNLYWSGSEYMTNWVFSECAACRLESVKPDGYCSSGGQTKKCTEIYGTFPACVSQGDEVIEDLGIAVWKCEFNVITNRIQWDRITMKTTPFVISLPFEETNAVPLQELNLEVSLTSYLDFTYDQIIINPPELYDNTSGTPIRKPEWDKFVISYVNETGHKVMGKKIRLSPGETKKFYLKLKLPNNLQPGRKVVLNVSAKGSFTSDTMTINIIPNYHYIRIENALLFDAYGNPLPNTPVTMYICNAKIKYCTEDAPYLYKNSTVSDETGYFSVSLNVSIPIGMVYKVSVVTPKGYAEAIVNE